MNADAPGGKPIRINKQEVKVPYTKKSVLIAKNHLKVTALRDGNIAATNVT